jgi:hypothetical protein
MAVEDILIGPVTAYYAPVATALPDETSVAFGAAWGGAWASLGYTKEDTPLSWNLEKNTKMVGAQQTILKLKAVHTEETLALETTLIELTPANLGLVIGGTVSNTVASAGQKGYSKVEGGGLYLPTLYAIGFEGMRVMSDGTQQPVRFFVWKGVLTIGGALEFGKDDETGMAIHVDALADTSKAANKQLYYIEIVTAAATS